MKLDARYILKDNSNNSKKFLHWEKLFSQRGKKYSLTSAQKLPNRVFLHTLLGLFMMVFGTASVWGQDYSGIYYIASGGKSAANGNSYTYNSSTPSNNFYLCPTEGWCYYKATNDFSGSDDDTGMPFLTTYNCRSAAYHSGDATDAIWIIEKAPDSEYYYIIQYNGGKYLVSNGQIRTTDNPDRIRVHLETTVNPAALGDKVLFEISPTDTYIEISPKGITDGTSSAHGEHDKHKWLTVNNGNYNYLTGQSGKTGGPTGYANTCGIVCIYSKGDANGKFILEDARCTTPSITDYDSGSGKVTITSTEGATIYYTTDGSEPDPAHSGGENPTQVYNSADKPTGITTIKAIAVKTNMVNSKVATIKVVPSPTITLSIPDGGYINDGTAKKPTVTVRDGETIIPPSEYEVEYANNTTAGTATVTITNAAGGNYFINSGSVNFTIKKSIGNGTSTVEGIVISLTKTTEPETTTVTVTDNETSLTLGEDYTWAPDEDNPNIIIVTGMGEYGGSAKIVYATVNFTAIPTEDRYGGTYLSELDLLAPTGMEVYIVKKVNATIGTITLSKIDYIPKDVPVLMVASSEQTGFAASTVNFNLKEPISDAVLKSNLFQVAPDEPSDPADPSSTHGVAVKDAEAYLFYKGEFVLTLEGVIGPGKIFLKNPIYTEKPASPAPAPARSLRIVVEEDATSIHEEFGVKGEKFPTNGSWFMIDGRQLNGKPSQKGLYIVNGKKVFLSVRR